jgi:hypothetical protein
VGSLWTPLKKAWSIPSLRRGAYGRTNDASLRTPGEPGCGRTSRTMGSRPTAKRFSPTRDHDGLERVITMRGMRTQAGIGSSPSRSQRSHVQSSITLSAPFGPRHRSSDAITLDDIAGVSGRFAWQAAWQRGMDSGKTHHLGAGGVGQCWANDKAGLNQRRRPRRVRGCGPDNIIWSRCRLIVMR